MPKRVIDFDAMWGSDKLASCADWAQAEYAWLYGLADASGCFEMTNLRVIWGRVAAVRENFTIERLEQVFAEFQDKGLLFVWAHEGKRYAHWTGSDVPGRLPPPSWRMRLEKFAPPVPKLLLAEYMARFARGRAALAGVGFRGESEEDAGKGGGNLKFQISNLKSGRGADAGDPHFEGSGAAAGYENCGTGRRGENTCLGNLRDGGRENSAREIGLKGGVEGDQAQDLNLNLDLDLDLKWNGERVLERDRAGAQVLSDRAESEIKDDCFCKSNSSSRTNARANASSTESSTAKANANTLTGLKANSDARANSRAATSELNSNANSSLGANSSFNSNADSRLKALGNEMRNAAAYRMSAREIAVERELRVGAGPVCGPVRIRPEVLERIRLREEARARAVKRSP
jgi:hypothetical protein